MLISKCEGIICLLLDDIEDSGWEMELKEVFWF